jgi:hypothetical protein
MACKFSILYYAILILFFPIFLLDSSAAETTATPSLSLKLEYDDNINFDEKDETGDFSGSAIPGLQFNYLTELLEFSAYAEVDFKRYLDETDFDRTNQLYGIDSKYQMLERLYFLGELEYRKDETTDSQLEDTGRVFERDRRERYYADGGLRYQISELSEVGPNFSYEKMNFSSKEDDDYDLYRISLTYSKEFKNQRDTIFLRPSHAKYDSDTQDGDGYRFEVGWKRLFGETITSDILVGARYTKIDRKDKDRDNTDNNWGGVGRINLAKIGETYIGNIGYSHDISSNTEGEIIEVDRLYLNLNKKILERFGLKFSGSAYYSRKESGDKDKVRYFILKPSLYYMLTQEHSLELFYSYDNEVELDEPGNPETQRNRVWMVLNLQFPKKW